MLAEKGGRRLVFRLEKLRIRGTLTNDSLFNVALMSDYNVRASLRTNYAKSVCLRVVEDVVGGIILYWKQEFALIYSYYESYCLIYVCNI